MTTLHDHIQMLRAELTSFYLSRRERRQIERELKEALGRQLGMLRSIRSRHELVEQFARHWGLSCTG